MKLVTRTSRAALGKGKLFATAVRPLAVALATVVAALSFPWAAKAGTGSIDPSSGELSLNVLLSYPPPQADIDTLSATLQQVSEILCDATEGQIRIGEVTIRSGGCESGDCQTGRDQADIWFSPTNNPGAGQSHVCVDGEPCSSLGRNGSNVVLSRYYLDKPSGVAHELGHYVLNLADGYRQYQCNDHRPPYRELFDCGELTATNTSLMLAAACGNGVDYSELTTDATLPPTPQPTCADASDVLEPVGACPADSICQALGGYGADYDGFKNETASPRLPVCQAFNPATCEYEYSATQWFGYFNHKEILSELEQAALNVASLNDGDPVFDTVVTGVPNPGVPAARAAFCAQAVNIDVQVDIPTQVALVLDRSYSMAFPTNEQFEKCDPVAGCPEICGNKNDDDGDGVEDEADCRAPRIESLKSLSLNYFDFMAAAPAEAIEVGVQSFACSSREDVELQVITADLVQSTYNPAVDDLNPNGSTAIADALLAAAETFDGGGNRAILLVTDGFNSCGDSDVNGTIQQLVNEGIVVDAITFGAAVGSLESARIADQTGGKFLSAGKATDLGPAFARQWANRVHAGKLIPQLPYHVAVPSAGTPVNIRDARVIGPYGSTSAHFGESPDEIPAASIDRFELVVEPGTTRILALLASSEEDYDTVGIRARLSGPPGPNGDLYDTDSPEVDPLFTVTRRRAYTALSVESPNPGRWTLDVIPPVEEGLDPDQQGYVTVLSQSGAPSFVADITRRFVSDTDEGTIVTGYARYREAAMAGATVRATLRRPDGSTANVAVRGGTDPMPESGYSVRLAGADIQEPGRYEVRLSLFASPAETTLRQGHVQPGPPLPVTLERTVLETFWVLDEGRLPCECDADFDCDNDGVVGESAWLDTDGDGTADACDADSDNDEIDDGWDHPGDDIDGDGSPDPQDPDSDGDGVVDGSDPDFGACVPPAVWIGNASSDLCEGIVRLDVLLRSGDPVLEAEIPISLPGIGAKVLDVSPGIDAVQAGLLAFEVQPVENDPNELTVVLSFDPQEPLAPGHALRIVDVELSTGSVAGPVAAEACPTVKSLGPSIEVAHREHCGIWHSARIAADVSCGDVALGSVDADNDGIGDACDNCPYNRNQGQSDVDLDGIGDRCDAVTAACADGTDNDGDGLVDALDPGCQGSGDLSEHHGALVCDNGIDDDFDGDADVLDAQCRTPLDPSEE